MNKNEVFEVAKTIVNGIKTFRSYNEEFELDDYKIIVEPSSNRYDGGYRITFIDPACEEEFERLLIWDEDADSLATKIRIMLEEQDSKSEIMNFVHKVDEFTEDDKELEALYNESFELSFHGMKVEIPWGAPSYNALTDALKQIHSEMGI